EGATPPPSRLFAGLVRLASIGRMRLHGAALKMRALLDAERLVVNVADHVRPRLQHHLAALNRPFDPTLDDHLARLDRSAELGIPREDEGCTLQLPLDLPVNLHQAFRGDLAHDPQSFADYGST